ncbi:hypothetical protein AVEN_114431-1 [Araneus ventricosus]|uniref:RNase H type-1 domain-containing protein n=1 Tax=Araneus ventricosus TaxID=182803 RepID=A0A4Y2RNC8_ARAVE|nr:hypothetical protein AVEN_114431-1 [Araneus ventricosus]
MDFPQWESISVHWRLDGDLAEKCKIMFTDGSNLHDRVSCGVICLDLENLVNWKREIRINDEASVFTAKAVVLLKAFERLDHIDEEVRLFTDSRSMLMALNSVKHTHPLIDRIRLFLVSKPNTCLNWIKAHIDIEGNELDDLIAKSAIMKDNIDFNAEIPKSWIIIETLQQKLDMSQKARFLSRLMSVVNNRICYGDFFINSCMDAFQYTKINVLGSPPTMTVVWTREQLATLYMDVQISMPLGRNSCLKTYFPLPCWTSQLI